MTEAAPLDSVKAALSIHSLHPQHLPEKRPFIRSFLDHLGQRGARTVTGAGLFLKTLPLVK
jgi:hypothetical protein